MNDTDEKQLKDIKINHYEILNKVKKINLIEGLDMMTKKQIAEYFECTTYAIEKICERNRNFIPEDGSKILTYKELEECEYLTVIDRKRGKVIAKSLNDIEVVYSGRGLSLFNVEGIMNIGLHLRDNKIANKIKEYIFGTNKVLSYRKEVIFFDKLEQVLLPLGIKGTRQYRIDEYRIDYYIPDYGAYTGLAIEYDEYNHKYYSYENQEYRQAVIEDKTQCSFIRLSDSNSDEYNIGLVIKFLLEDKDNIINVLK